MAAAPKRIRTAKIEIKTDGSICFTPTVASDARTFHDVASVLERCRNLGEIEIDWHALPNVTNFRLMLGWMELASKLHALPKLKSIQLEIYFLLHPFADMLIDSLPDKVTSLQALNLRVATLLRKRKKPLSVVQFGGHVDEHPYLADVCRLKSEIIGLVLGDQSRNPFHNLLDCGPFDANEHVDGFQLRVDLERDGRTLLRHLRAINVDFQLVCMSTIQTVSLSGPGDLKQVADIEQKAKKFAVQMRDGGFDGEADQLVIVIADTFRWKFVSREPLIDLFKWKRGEVPEDDSTTTQRSSFVHNGVRIVMDLDS